MWLKVENKQASPNATMLRNLPLSGSPTGGYTASLFWAEFVITLQQGVLLDNGTTYNK